MSEQLSTALVTGGSRGIGKAIAETLAKAGYQVYLTYVSKADEAEAVARNIVAAGGKACAFRLDVADAEAVAAFFKERIKDQVELDVLVNNAGITKDPDQPALRIRLCPRGRQDHDPPASRADHQYQLRGRTDG